MGLFLGSRISHGGIACPQASCNPATRSFIQGNCRANATVVPFNQGTCTHHKSRTPDHIPFFSCAHCCSTGWGGRDMPFASTALVNGSLTAIYLRKDRGQFQT